MEALSAGTTLTVGIIAAATSLLVGTIGPTISALVTAWALSQRVEADRVLAREKFDFDRHLAEKKSSLDRESADWHRKTELAEQVLADFYQARAIFQTARHPAGYANEGHSRPGREDEDEVERCARDSYYAPLERLTREAPFLAGVYARRFRFMALFGQASGQPFSALIAAQNRLAISTAALLRGSAHHLSAERFARYEADIWGVGDEDDEIARQIDTAVVAIEGICSPILNVPYDRVAETGPGRATFGGDARTEVGRALDPADLL